VAVFVWDSFFTHFPTFSLSATVTSTSLKHDLQYYKKLGKANIECEPLANVAHLGPINLVGSKKLIVCVALFY